MKKYYAAIKNDANILMALVKVLGCDIQKSIITTSRTVLSPTAVTSYGLLSICNAHLTCAVRVKQTLDLESVV